MDQTMEEFRAEQLRVAITGIANQLRRIAEDVDRSALRVEKVGTAGTATYGSIVEDVVYAVQWGVANARLERVPLYGCDADAARAQRRTAEQVAVDIEGIVGGYPDNAVERPKVERGGHLNDAAWAAQLARSRKEG